MGIPLCDICCFSLAAFNICSLCLILVNLINMCLGVFRLGFILFGTLWVSWTWVIISFPILGKFSTIISSSIFSWSFFLSSSSETPIIRMLEMSNTAVCLQCLSPAGPAPARGAHRSGSRLLRWEPSEAGPRLHAPPRSKPLRLGAQVAPRGADLVWPVFRALPRSE